MRRLALSYLTLKAPASWAALCGHLPRHAAAAISAPAAGAGAAVPYLPLRILAGPGCCWPARGLASASAEDSAGTDHDPVRTRLIHLMVLGTFIAAGSNVLPYMGVHSVENSAKLLSSKDTMMQRAGADRLRHLASFSAQYRQDMAAGPAFNLLAAKAADPATAPEVLEASLQALLELVKDENGRKLLAGNQNLQGRLETISAEKTSDDAPSTQASSAATLLKDIRRPPLAN